MVPGCAINQKPQETGCTTLASGYIDIVSSLEQHTAVTRECTHNVSGWATVAKSFTCGSALPSGLIASFDVLSNSILCNDLNVCDACAPGGAI